MTLRPCVVDTLRTACGFQAKVQKDIIHDASAAVKQELLMIPLLSPSLVSPEKAKEALKMLLRK